MSLSTASSCTGCYYSLIPHTNWNASKVLTQTVIQNHTGNLYISFDLYRSRETEEWLLEMHLSFWRRREAGTEDVKNTAEGSACPWALLSPMPGLRCVSTARCCHNCHFIAPCALWLPPSHRLSDIYIKETLLEAKCIVWGFVLSF